MTKFVITVIGISILALGLIIAFGDRSSGGNNTANASYSLDRTRADLGKMKVSEDKSAIFNLQNTDSKNIMLRGFNTSCDCTEAIVKIGSQTSPRFNMTAHMSSADASWEVELSPGESAQIEVIYMPSRMPVYGKIDRFLNFKVNDQQQRLTVSAFVE